MFAWLFKNIEIKTSIFWVIPLRSQKKSNELEQAFVKPGRESSTYLEWELRATILSRKYLLFSASPMFDS